jgi:hypothetical protein
MFPTHADRIVLDSNVNPKIYGPALFSQNGPAMNAALKNWAGFAARRNSTYKLGTSSKQVLANVDLIRTHVDKRSLKIGRYTVDSHVLPLLLGIANDSIQSLTEQSAMVQLLRDAAKGRRVAPTEAFTAAMYIINSPVESQLASVHTAIICADRAANRNPASYLKDIDRHRKAEPLFGPLLRNIGPCAFWPTKPREPATTIRSTHPALLLNATGDTQTPYAGAQVMHKALAGSRLVTLRNAYRHGIFLTGASDCADLTVQRYLVNGVLPQADVSCTTDRATGLPSRASLAGKVPASLTPTAADQQWPWQSKFFG